MPITRQILIQEAFSATYHIEHPWQRSRALLYLARLLPADLLPQALELARALDQPHNRAIALAFLARNSSDQQKTVLIDETSQIIQDIPDPAARLWPLVTIAGLQPDQTALITWREILECLPFESDLHRRAHWLAGLPEVLLSEGLKLVQSMPDPAARADALVELAGSLPEEKSAPLLIEALRIVRGLSNPAEQAFWGSALLASFPEAECPALLDSTMQAALIASDQLVTVAVISYLAGLFPANLLRQALDLAQQLSDPANHANCLVWLAPYLPDDHQSAVIAEAFKLIQSIPDEWNRTDSLELLFPLLPSTEHVTALEICRLIQDPWARTNALGGLSECLEADLKELVFSEATSSARSIKSWWGRARSLTTLATHISG